MITLRGLTKRYGKTLAVNGLDLQIHPGRVTGFLGPNGAGKTTTLRMVLGLDRPTAGQALINGRPYRELRPLRTVGAVLNAKSVHSGRTAHSHLLALARALLGPTTVRATLPLKLEHPKRRTRSPACAW